jgi:hypothetical protein
MRALVVFESMFGNTQRVAEAIAEGLNAELPTEVVEVAHAPSAIGLEVRLVVVGGPTHAFGMSRPRTREAATQQGSGVVGSTAVGIREWLADVTIDRTWTAAATFDTRIRKPLVPGSAARGAQRLLRRHGVPILAPAESFAVTDTTGPLADGELDRARRWGARLGARLFAGAAR